MPRRAQEEVRMSRLGDAWTELLATLADETDEAAARKHARWMADRLAVWPPQPGAVPEVPTWRSLHIQPGQADVNRRGRAAALKAIRKPKTADPIPREKAS
jgi:hypothetical protein